MTTHAGDCVAQQAAIGAAIAKLRGVGSALDMGLALAAGLLDRDLVCINEETLTADQGIVHQVLAPAACAPCLSLELYQKFCMCGCYGRMPPASSLQHILAHMSLCRGCLGAVPVPACCAGLSRSIAQAQR